MRPRSHLLTALLLVTIAIGFGCTEEEKQIIAENSGSSAAKIYDLLFGPSMSVKVTNVNDCDGTLGRAQLRSRLVASANGGTARRMGNFGFGAFPDLEFSMDETKSVPASKLIRVDEGDEVCVSSLESAERGVGAAGDLPLSEDEQCITLGSNAMSLDFTLTMRPIGGANPCELEVSISAAATAIDEGTVFQPAAVTASSTFSTLDENHLIDGTGLSGTDPLKAQTHGTGANAEGMWHPAPAGGNPPSVAAQSLTFDLGESKDLEGIYVWNLNQTGLTGRGARQFTVLVSSDPAGGVFASLGVVEIDEACDCPAETAQFLAATASNVRRVRFAFISTWSGRMAGGEAREYVGLSEVAFVETK